MENVFYSMDIIMSQSALLLISFSGVYPEQCHGELVEPLPKGRTLVRLVILIIKVRRVITHPSNTLAQSFLFNRSERGVRSG